MLDPAQKRKKRELTRLAVGTGTAATARLAAVQAPSSVQAPLVSSAGGKGESGSGRERSQEGKRKRERTDGLGCCSPSTSSRCRGGR